MSGTLESRGPDDQGIWINNVNKICFGHKRLSILDLSQLGRQPMVKDRFVITYNGEIYNYLEIKEELKKEGKHFKSNCDTEVLVHLYEEYGLNAPKFINGNFAFAIYDLKKNELILGRDRFGIRPLFYTYHRNTCGLNILG